MRCPRFSIQAVTWQGQKLPKGWAAMAMQTVKRFRNLRVSESSLSISAMARGRRGVTGRCRGMAGICFVVASGSIPSVRLLEP